MISAPVILLAGIVVISWIAAVYDLWTMKIPNYFPLIVIGVFLVFAPFFIGAWTDLLWQGLSLIIAFLGALTLYIMGPMGGGDVKLFAALGLWVTLENILPWVLSVTLSGLLITLIFLTYRMAVLIFRDSASLKAAFSNVRKSAIPYGPAIALGTTGLFFFTQ